MKLKLGLCHELHHPNESDLLAGDYHTPTPNILQDRGVNPRKSKPIGREINLEDIISNRIEIKTS
jgi:hypothetical protein